MEYQVCMKQCIKYVLAHFEKYANRFCLSDSLLDCGGGGCDGPE